MSPASLRRYRAERLLREEFRSLRARVIASARGSLRSCGVQLDESDLEACYAQAWQGLYTATLEGQRIVNPAGWLTVATVRRAIDEHRARARTHPRDRRVEAPEALDWAPDRHAANGAWASGQDAAAAELDGRIELRRVFEALALRLSARERQAAALCYLQGLTRAEAARTMGVSEARMRKLMEGRGAGRPGVAGKVGSLLATIRDGAWCEQQGSLMRGFAYGILDPSGERYRLAVAHTADCPACRAYVASLRGLAALVPPMPVLLEVALARAASPGAGLGAGIGHGAGAAAGAAPPGSAAGLAAPGALPSVAASGAAGAGVAGGGWIVTGGGVGVKLAAGCLLALGVGTGCAVLGTVASAPAPRHTHARRAPERIAQSAAGAIEPAARSLGAASYRQAPATPTSVAPARTATSAESRAAREFGPEQAAAAQGAESAAAYSTPSPPPRAGAATAARAGSQSGTGASQAGASSASEAQAPAQASNSSAALREFSPG